MRQVNLAVLARLHRYRMMPNNALERSVRGSSERAAGARTIIAPAAHSWALPRPAQRGR
jgi:hypothetical protein